MAEHNAVCHAECNWRLDAQRRAVSATLAANVDVPKRMPPTFGRHSPQRCAAPPYRLFLVSPQHPKSTLFGVACHGRLDGNILLGRLAPRGANRLGKLGRRPPGRMQVTRDGTLAA